MMDACPDLAHAPALPDPWEVDDEHERLALVAVRARLGDRFSEVDPAVVEAAVRLSYAELTGPVRDFVPLLVERAARDRLTFALRDAGAAASSARGPNAPGPDRVAAGTPAPVGVMAGSLPGVDEPA